MGHVSLPSLVLSGYKYALFSSLGNRHVHFQASVLAVVECYSDAH
jgi:hypothetical protein